MTHALTRAVQYALLVVFSCLITIEAAIASCTSRGFTDPENRVLEAYIAYYGRPADALGLAYWVQQLSDANNDLRSIIEPFGTSQEYVERFGGMAPSALITNLYDQLFKRQPDTAGLEWYTQALQSGERSLQNIALDILAGAQGDDALTVQARLTIAQHYVTQSELLSYPRVDSEALITILMNTGHDAQAVSQACSGIDRLIEFGDMEQGTCSPGQVTAEKEAQLQLGMNLQTVEAILGCAGELRSSSGDRVNYEWTSGDFDPVISVYFDNTGLIDASFINFAGLIDPVAGSTCTDDNVNQANADKLSAGMTLATIENTIGCAGVMMFSFGDFTEYQWAINDGYTTLVVLLENGLLDSSYYMEL